MSSAPRIVRTYLAITLCFNLAMSFIWGVDTLFKLDAGLDIFQVMLTNAAFTAGSVIFEIPTGVRCAGTDRVGLSGAHSRHRHELGIGTGR